MKRRTAEESLRGVAGAGAARSAAEDTRPPPPVPARRYLFEWAVVFAAYFVGGKIGLAAPFTSGNVSPLWPPAGIALAALLLAGTRVWPAIAAAAFLVNLLSPIPAGAAAVVAAGNTAGPLLAAWLVRRIPHFRPSFDRLNDVYRLILVGAPASAAVSATVGVTVLFLTRLDPWERFAPAWLVWWFGDALGVLIVTPLVLTVFKRGTAIVARRPELMALAAATVVASALIFDSRVGAGMQKDALAFAVFPLVLWGATRFEVPGAAGVTLVIASIAVWETGAGHGLFLGNTTVQNAAMLQGFLALISVSGLVLAAVIAERAECIREQATREGRDQTDEQYHEIVETANDGIWMLDGQLVTVFVNPRMAEILGYTAEEMMAKHLSEFVSETTWEVKRAGMQRRGGPTVREHTETQYQKKDGSVVWANVSRTLAFAEDGTFTGILKMVSDITEQKRAESERQHALDRLALLSEAVEQTADTVLISDGEGRILYVNPAFEATTGYTKSEILGKTPRLLKSGRQGEAFYEHMWGRLLAGDSYRGTLVNRRKSGELYWANQTITPIRDPAGKIAHFVSVLRDVTEARRYHEQEVQLRLARAVQQRFYPTPPRLPGYDIGAASEPARETGGDYFDFIEAPEGVLYVAIGDVSGHGFDTALIMALTRAYLRSFARLGMDVGEVFRLANEVLVDDLEDNRYVTMLLVRLDTRAGTVTYASAGHVAGLILDGAKGTDRFMDSTGVPLGMFPGSTFETRRIELEPGQVLVLVTDGATEATNTEGVEFGLQGVAAHVRSHAGETAADIAAAIHQAVRSFGAADHDGDDLTSVVLKVTGAPPAEQESLPLPTESPGPESGDDYHAPARENR